MFVAYLPRELRRRMRQAVFIALGLALGVGLVITVTAASAGNSGNGGQSFRADFNTSSFGGGGVNTTYVAASSSPAIGGVSGEISRALPSDTVTTSSDLACEAAGPLSSASSAGRQPRQVARHRGACRGVPAGQPADDGGGLAPGA